MCLLKNHDGTAGGFEREAEGTVLDHDVRVGAGRPVENSGLGHASELERHVLRGVGVVVRKEDHVAVGVVVFRDRHDELATRGLNPEVGGKGVFLETGRHRWLVDWQLYGPVVPVFGPGGGVDGRR